MRNVHPSGEFPDLFLDRLKAIIKLENNPLVIESFRRQKVCSVRVNTIKTSTDKAIEYFSNSSLSFQKISWSSEVFIFNDVDPSEVSRLDWVSQGNLYIQGLSSMLPVIVLDPKPGERVLDLCAAPGSKTTQIAALMNNEGEIVAIDSVRPRFYRLKAVLALNGVEMARPKCLDGAKYRSSELFDRILVDAPCSSEARFKMSDAKTFGYWSLRKIKEMAHKQKGLLLNACRLLKPGGTLVYSTCTFAPEENESVIDWVLRKLPGQIEVQPVELPGIMNYPSLLEWEKRMYDSRVQQCFRVLPTSSMEGFFITKLTRV